MNLSRSDSIYHKKARSLENNFEQFPDANNPKKRATIVLTLNKKTLPLLKMSVSGPENENRRINRIAKTNSSFFLLVCRLGRQNRLFILKQN